MNNKLGNVTTDDGVSLDDGISLDDATNRLQDGKYDTEGDGLVWFPYDGGEPVTLLMTPERAMRNPATARNLIRFHASEIQRLATHLDALANDDETLAYFDDDNAAEQK